MKSWNFLRAVTFNEVLGSEAPGVDADSKKNATSPAIIDAENTGSLRGMLGNNLLAFEQSLQDISRLPDQFRLVMAPIETAVAQMGLLRRQLAASEAQLARETTLASSLQQDVDHLAERLDRLQRDLLTEQTNTASLQQRVINLDSDNARHVQANLQLSAALQRSEAELAETASQLRDSARQLADMAVAQANADQRISELHEALERANGDSSGRETRLAALTLSEKQHRARLEQATQSIAELETAVRHYDERYGETLAALQRERDTAAGLRTELNRTRQMLIEVQARLEGQTETAQTQSAMQEQRIESMRARLAETDHGLAMERRARRDSEFELSRIRASLESATRTTADLRAQLTTATEAQAALTRKLAEESERNQALAAQLSATRDKAAEDYKEFQANIASFRSSESTLNETLSRLRQRLVVLEAENERLHQALPSFAANLAAE